MAQQQAQGQYSYASQPQAAPVKRKQKYRDENEVGTSLDGTLGNLMNDPRVIRGSTYAAKVQSNDPLAKKSMGSSKTRNDPPLNRKKVTGRRVSTPPPVEGRSHMDMQTDDFLEELTDRPIEIDAETQTQPFMDRPASPLFVRAKIGHDMETQIAPGDLFDFDLEVEPILEVLVGKTIHVAMLELMQEEELEAIRIQQEEFEAIRNVELAEVQRLESEARRKAQEKERRLAQERKRLADKKALEEKIAARSFSQQYLGALHVNVFDQLQEEGFFFDPIQREVEDIFMVDLIADVRRRADSYNAAQEMANELLEAARNKVKAFAAEAIRLREEARLREIARLEAEAAAKAAEEEARLAAEAAAAAAEGTIEGAE